MSGAAELNERLFGAVEACDVEAARRALADGADAGYVKLERGDGYSTEVPVLFVACVRKSLALVELLLAHGADPDACRKDDESWHEKDTCLRAAMPSLEVVALLLEKGADPNQPSESGESCRIPTHALDDARDNAELTALLVRYGADRDKSPAALAELSRKNEAAAKREQMIANTLAKRPTDDVQKRGKKRR
jgi:ankyrin repeat protein